ncbi:cation:proton antiporter regulatory subunit [Nocardia sp. 2]|uniref:Cation:proton antiporter regulatory subunit n=1 Tax=Nocardia acididurans TaxID=2802282 RepID=A0ABS1MA93_9NOCA|nr:cation:proton antiporter regulatory subunit [Nocardia acididurans]MBL1077164.1 cation:proton antiporter regulatory subunit [Nocardia acididurans]
MNVEVTPLPGIGVRKEFPLKGAKRRIGVIDHRDGTIELVVSKPGKPHLVDRILLSRAEAAVLANLLGAPQLVAQLREEHRELGGVITRQMSVPPGSPYDGRVLGDSQMRTRTKASIVAVLRSGHPVPSPEPDFVLTAGDILVVVGTEEGLAAAAGILVDG